MSNSVCWLRARMAVRVVAQMLVSKYSPLRERSFEFTRVLPRVSCCSALASPAFRTYRSPSNLVAPSPATVPPSGVYVGFEIGPPRGLIGLLFFDFPLLQQQMHVTINRKSTTAPPAAYKYMFSRPETKELVFELSDDPGACVCCAM